MADEAIIPLKPEAPIINPVSEVSSSLDPIETDIVRQELLSRAQRRSSARVAQIKLFDDATAATTGDGRFIFFVPPELDNLDLFDVYAYVTTVSSSGALTIQVRNVTDTVDMLSTAITIDQSEFSSLTAATPPVINNLYSRVSSGDRIALDVDGAGTGTTGLGVVLTFN